MKKKLLYLFLICVSMFFASNVSADAGTRFYEYDGDINIVEQCVYTYESEKIVVDVTNDTAKGTDWYRLELDKDTDSESLKKIKGFSIWRVNNNIVFSNEKYFGPGGPGGYPNDACPKYLIRDLKYDILYFGDEEKHLEQYRDEFSEADTKVYNLSSHQHFDRIEEKPYEDPEPEEQDNKKAVCGVLTENVQKFIYNILDWIKYIALVLAIGLSVLDFFKAIASEEDDAFTKAGKRLAKRIAIVVALFLLPVILEFVLKLVHIQGVDSSNPMCK